MLTSKEKRKKIYWTTTGYGKINIVLFHGWGICSVAWKRIVNLLKPYFILHLIDLPGFGNSFSCPIMTFQQLSTYLLQKIKKKVIWLGWSMGGLIAHYLGLNYPNQTLSVIYVTSSPYFIQEKNWPGVTINTLDIIKTNILLNYKEFYQQFILFHCLNSESQDMLDFKKQYFFLNQYPNPKKQSIEIGYQWLINIDHREKILSNKIPTLRIYGSLDNIVPIQTCHKTSTLWPRSNYYIITRARHAPFLSHPFTFCKLIHNFIKDKIS